MSKLALNGGISIYSGEWPLWPEAGDPEKEVLARVIDSNRWSYNGPLEFDFKQKWSDFTGAKHTLLAANGTVSLQLALEALGIGYGDEVILPGLTWQADSGAIVDINAVPVLVDIEEDSWCISPEEIKKAISPRTKAIIPVHLYGTICDIKKVLEIAERHDLYVIEDCAHQHGSVFRGKHIGTFGNAGSFSLQKSKVLTCGEGGIVITNDDDLFVKLDALRNCGRRPESMLKKEGDFSTYTVEGDLIQSGNYRITEFQAAVLTKQFERLPNQLERRDNNAQYLNEKLGVIEGITPMLRRDGTDIQSYFNFAFRYDKNYFNDIPVNSFRKALSAELNFKFEGSYEPLNNCSLYRPLTKHRHKLNEEYFKLIDPSRFHLPVCERVFGEESVTAHHSLLLGTRKDCDRIIEAILKIKENLEELRNEAVEQKP